VEPLLYTPEDAAKVLTVSRTTVYDLMRLNLLTSVKIGRARRIPAEALRQYVDRLVEESVVGAWS
jgi:excisionase family DNA binding protein